MRITGNMIGVAGAVLMLGAIVHSFNEGARTRLPPPAPKAAPTPPPKPHTLAAVRDHFAAYQRQGEQRDGADHGPGLGVRMGASGLAIGFEIAPGVVMGMDGTVGVGVGF